MSLKPQKKSDMKKGWMKARRDVPKKILPEYHLIVTESTDTEPAYFGTIRDIINSKHRGRINLEIVGEGDNTLNLFEKAKNKVQMNLSMYGLCMTQMIFLRIILIRLHSDVLMRVRRRLSIMLFGQISV